VTIFSVVNFYGKPGEIQQQLTESAKARFEEGTENVTNYNDVFTYLRGPYLDLLYPDRAYDPVTGADKYLGMPDRLYVNGDARVLSAHRIRQVRSLKEDCRVMDFMKTVDGYDITCYAGFDGDPDENDIYKKDTAEYTKLGDFREPFLWRNQEQLGTTDVSISGIYASYPQEGFALDLIPNYSPRMFAERLRACEKHFQDSIDACAVKQGFAVVDQRVVSECENPMREGEKTFPLKPLAFNIGLDVEKCIANPAIPDTCMVGDLPLAVAAKYFKDEHCASCTCKPDNDDFCNKNCAPKSVMGELISRLEVNLWLGDPTRAVIIDSALFNESTNLFTLNRTLMEFPPVSKGGLGALKSETETVRLFRYITTIDTAVLALEIVLMVMVVYYSITELVELRNMGTAYFSDPWNYVDWANYIILYVVFALRYLSWEVIKDSKFSALQESYVDFPTLVSWANAELQLIAFNFFLVYFKIFKYLANVPRMDAILVTISSCAFDLALFMLMATIIQFGFVAAFLITFGPYLNQFATFGRTLSELMRVLLGDFDYNELRQTNGLMGPLLFYLYISFVFFIILNMFLAIVTDAYAEVKANQTEEDLLYYINLKDKLLDKMSVLMGRKKAINKLAMGLLENADDGKVTMDELRELVKDNPAALAILETTTVEELMEKYDINKDGSLSKSELREILQELAEQEEAIQGTIDEREAQAGKLARAGSRARRGGGGGDVGGENVFIATEGLEKKLLEVDDKVSDLSRTVAKKMALMIELMMSLSDQVGR